MIRLCLRAFFVTAFLYNKTRKKQAMDVENKNKE